MELDHRLADNHVLNRCGFCRSTILDQKSVYCDQCGKALVTTTKEEDGPETSQKKPKKFKKKTSKQTGESVQRTIDEDDSPEHTKKKSKKKKKKKKANKNTVEEAIPECDLINSSPDPSARPADPVSSPLLKNTNGSWYWGNPQLLHEVEKQQQREQKEHDGAVPLPSQHHSPSKKDLPPILGPRIVRTHPKERPLQLSPLSKPHQSSKQQEENPTTKPRLLRHQRSVSDTTVEVTHEHRGTVARESLESRDSIGTSSRYSTSSGDKHLCALPDLSKAPIPRTRRHERKSIDTTMVMNISNTTMNNSAGSSHTTNSTSGGSQVVLWGDCLESASKAFQAKEVILVAEIEADERCFSFLKQHFVLNNIDPEIRRKQESLERKIQMNKEKLALVRARLQQLGHTQYEYKDLLTRDHPSNNHEEQQQQPQHAEAEGGEISHTTKRKHQQRTLRPSKKAKQAAAIRIQAFYRGYQARKQVMAMLHFVYQRVYDPESDRYFFYNSKTQQSTWEFKSRHLSQLYSTITTDNDTSKKPKKTTNKDKTEEAALKIQRLYRSRAARQFMRDLAQGVIQKCFDEDYQTWYYYNHRTNQSSWEKPKLLAASSSVSSVPVLTASDSDAVNTDVVDRLLEEKFQNRPVQSDP